MNTRCWATHTSDAWSPIPSDSNKWFQSPDRGTRRTECSPCTNPNPGCPRTSAFPAASAYRVPEHLQRSKSYKELLTTETQRHGGALPSPRNSAARALTTKIQRATQAELRCAASWPPCLRVSVVQSASWNLTSE